MTRLLMGFAILVLMYLCALAYDNENLSTNEFSVAWALLTMLGAALFWSCLGTKNEDVK